MTASRLPKASDAVVEGLRRWIISRNLPVGHQLPGEIELADRYGVGRAAVREALRLLERDGLVQVRRGVRGGIFVRHPEIGQVGDVVSLLFATRGTTIGEWVDFRLLVEPAAAELAATHASGAQRDELAAAIDPTAAVDLPHVPDLHIVIAEASGNGVLAIALGAMRASFDEHFRPNRISDSDLSATDAAHRKIARRIIAGDGPGARRAMTVHLNSYRDYMREQGLLTEPFIAH